MQSKSIDLVETARADLAAMIAVARRGLVEVLPNNGREFTDAADKFIATYRKISARLEEIPLESVAIKRYLPWGGEGSAFVIEADQCRDPSNKAVWRAHSTGILDACEAAWQEKLAELEKLLPAANSERVNNRVVAPENRTKPMTYRAAAKHIGKGDSRDAAEWLKKSVDDGSYACEHISRQNHVFDKRDFPEDRWPFILPM